MAGKVDPLSDEARDRAVEAAGLAVTGNVAAQALRRPRGLLAAMNEVEHDPPRYPQRPFDADYPNGATADEAGKLQYDIGGRPLTARYIAGRRQAGQPDTGLSSDELAGIVEGRTGHPPYSLPRRAIGGDRGATLIDQASGEPLMVGVADDLHPEDVRRVLGHETGHVVDQTAGNIPITGIEDQLYRNYDTLQRGRDPGQSRIGPEGVGYPDEQIPQELMAEAVRAYLSDPNYLKTVGPETAARIREYVNAHPRLKDIIQFNSVPAGIIGAGSLLDDDEFQKAWEQGYGA
jgi:hypothetical protein